MAYIENVTEKTGCLYLSYNCIPFYRITEKEWIFLDSGYKYDTKDLFEFLHENDITIRAALCTHGHFDHIGNHAMLKKTFGTRIILSLYDAALVENNFSLKSLFYSSTEEEINENFKEMIVDADELILPGQTSVDIDGFVFQIISLPGHAVDHKGYITPDGVAYLGDCLQSPEIVEKEKLTYMIRWREQFRSMEQLKTLSCPYYILAHKGVYTDIAPIIDINEKVLLRQAERMKSLLTATMTLDQIVNEVFDKLRIFPAPMAKVLIVERTIRHCLEYLLETKQIRRFMKDGSLVYEKVNLADFPLYNS